MYIRTLTVTHIFCFLVMLFFSFTSSSHADSFDSLGLILPMSDPPLKNSPIE